MSLDKARREGLLRNNLARDRLGRLREELRLKKKIEEKLEKFSNQHLSTSPSSSKTNIFLDEFLLKEDQIKLHENEKREGFLNSRDRKLKLKTFQETCFKTKYSKTELTGNSLPVQKLSDSDKETSTCKKRKNMCKINKPSRELHSQSDAYWNSCNEPVFHAVASAACSSNEEKEFPTKHKKRKRGIAAKRLEKIRSSTPKCFTAKKYTPSDVDGIRKSSNESELENLSTFNPLKQLPERTFVKNSPQLPVIASDLMKNNRSLIHSWKSIEKQPISTDSNLRFSITSDVEKNEIDSEHGMDVDMDDSFSSVMLDTPGNSLQVEPDEWLENTKTDISFFNDEIQRIREDAAYLARHESYISDVEMNLSVPNGDFLIVVDTNIFLSHLRFLNRLLRSTIATYTSHILVVPWLVIQEIDYATKKSNRKLASQAKLANYFVFECLKKNDPKFFGQSFEDFKGNFKNAVSIDDFLLQYCLKLISLRNNVVLLSEDKNLCNKCMVSNVSVYTKDEFEKTFDIYDLK